MSFQYSICNLRDLFSLKDDNNLINRSNYSQQKYLEFIVDQLRFLNQNILNKLNSLPCNNWLRIILAPQTCNMIYKSQNNIGELETFINTSIENEINHITNNFANIDCWTAMGDIGYENGIIIQAFKTKSNVIIDFDSPYSKSPLIESEFRPKFSEHLPYSQRDKIKINKKIDDALSITKECTNGVYCFIKKHVQIIMPRLDHNKTFKGSSNRTIIGRVNLYNAHNDGIDFGAIACSLFHESIHNFLYIIELRKPFVISSSNAINTEIISPWSGKTINIIAYIHAMIVWYGILMFFRLKKVRKFFPDLTVQYYTEMSSRGFINKKAIKRINSFKENISPFILKELELIQESTIIGSIYE